MAGDAWSTKDVRWLIENAGKMPRHELATRLGRTERAVEGMALRLAKGGVPVSLRYREPPRTLACSSCGRQSASAWVTGTCSPCRLRRRIAAVEGQTAELLARLPPSERATYEESEVQRASRTPPRPVRGRSDEDAYQRALERWEEECLTRRLRAAQKRKERIARKVRKL